MQNLATFEGFDSLPGGQPKALPKGRAVKGSALFVTAKRKFNGSRTPFKRSHVFPVQGSEPDFI